MQAPLFALNTIAFGSLSIASSVVDKDGRAQHAIARVWARTTIGLSLARVDVVGAENLRKAPVAVYACNHTSYMDTPMLYSCASLPVPHTWRSSGFGRFRLLAGI